MSQCASCGAQIPEGVKFCTSCGAPVPVEAVAQPQFNPAAQQGFQQQPVQPMDQQQTFQQPVQPMGQQQPTYQQPMNQGYQQPYGQPAAAPAQPVTDSGSIGWGVLGFFIPIVGLILFLVWKNTKPNCAKVAGIGAIIGFCLTLIYNIGTMVASGRLG